MNKFLFTFFSLICIILMYSEVNPIDNFSVRVFITSIIIQLISFYFIFKSENKPFSLNKTFYLFSLFFFGVAPLLQFYKRSTFFGARELKENEYFFMNILIIIILIIYQLLYVFFYKKKIKNKKVTFLQKKRIDNKLNLLQTILLISLSLISFYVVFSSNNFNIMSMLIRGGEYKELIDLSSTEGLFLSKVFQPISMFCLLYYISSKSNNIIVYFVLILSALITCFPSAMARNTIAALYIPLFLLIFPWLRRKNIFSIIFILSFLLIFPFFNNFRNFDSTDFKLGFDFNSFSTGDFDSFQNFTLVVSDNICTLGNQLIGVLLFWIPRSIWLNKPIGSGAYIADKEGFYFSNVSCNYFAEGYINFGYLGILLFIILLSYLTARLDKIYWTISIKDKNNHFNIIYYVLIGMLFFLLRGDLMSSFAYTIGLIFSIWIVNVVVGIQILKNGNN